MTPLSSAVGEAPATKPLLNTNCGKKKGLFLKVKNGFAFYTKFLTNFALRKWWL